MKKKEKEKKRKRKKSIQNSGNETMTDADFADHLALLTNTPVQAKSWLHSLEQAAGGINFNMNINKIPKRSHHYFKW